MTKFILHVLYFLVGFATVAAVGGIVLKYMIPPDDKQGQSDGVPRLAADSESRRREPHAQTRPQSETGRFKSLEPGLDLGVFILPRHSSAVGDSRIRILRIDPARYEVRLLTASTTDPANQPATARQWCGRGGLLAAINAGGSQEPSPASRPRGGTMAARGPAAQQAGLAINMVDPHSRRVPSMQIVNLDNWTRRQYRTIVPGAGLLLLQGRPSARNRELKNVWQGDADRLASLSAIGIDGQRVFFIMARSPLTAAEFAAALTRLRIGLKGVIVTGVGPAAQLFVGASGRQDEFFGSYQTGVRENDDNDRPESLGAVAGIVKRPQTEQPPPEPTDLSKDVPNPANR